jgi:hypothetical protein
LSEFLDVKVNDDIKFNVLLSSNHILNDGSTISNNLKQILQKANFLSMPPRKWIKKHVKGIKLIQTPL